MSTNPNSSCRTSLCHFVANRSVRAKLLALVGGAVVLLTASTPPAVWNSKEFTAWTTEDAQQILNHSPWVKEWRTPASQRPGVVYVDADPAVNPAAPPTTEIGTSTGTTDRNGQPPSARTPSLNSNPVGAPVNQSALRIIWASARPIRMALLKVRSGKNPPTPEELARIENHWTTYLIAVVGLPAPEGGSDPKALAPNASLAIPGKPSVVATESDYRRIGNDDVYFFRFLKTALPLTSPEGTVEFKVKMDRMNITQKFDLAAMTYHGQLAL